MLEPDDTLDSESVDPPFIPDLSTPGTRKQPNKKESSVASMVMLGAGGFSILLLMFFCCGGGGGGVNTSRTPMTGDEAIIKDDCFVAASSDDLDRVTQLSVAKDEQGISQMLLTGRIRIVAAGTEVRVIDTGVFRYEIRLNDGSSGFLSPEFLRKK